MAALLQNTAYNQTFILVESSDHVTPLLGASPVVMLSKNAGAFSPAAGLVTEVGNGWYNVALTSTDTNTFGALSFHITAAGADDTDFSDQVIAFVGPPTPTPPVTPDTLLWAGWLLFIANVMRVPTVALPPDSPIIIYTFNFAVSTVNKQLLLACSPPGSWSPYQLAVYNLAADLLINWAQDPPGEPIYNVGPPPLQYFAWLRAQYGVNQFVAGVINASSDEGTSQSLTVPTAFEGLTIGQLSNLKTPYGRAYLALAQDVGTMWGLS